MPCSNCNHTLAYHPPKKSLFCPNCLELPVVDSDDLDERIKKIEDNYLNHPQFVNLISEYGIVYAVSLLLGKMNKSADIDENGISFEDFLHSTALLRSVYQEINSFETKFDPADKHTQEEVSEKIDDILAADTSLITTLELLKEDFIIPISQIPGYGDLTEFYRNNQLFSSEYRFCSYRCMKTVHGAHEEVADDFKSKEEKFRDFNKVDREDIETVQDFGDFWFDLISSLGFVVTLQKTHQDIFTTRFPNSVSIFDIEKFNTLIDDVVREQLHERGENEFYPLILQESDFDRCGKQVFGKEWKRVKGCILVSESNPDAHPLYFRVEGQQEMPARDWKQSISLRNSGDQGMNASNWNESRYTQTSFIIYPNKYVFLLERQIYPILNNGDDTPHSREILQQLNGRRGNEFEKNIYEYLIEKEVNAHFSCKVSKSKGKEIDLIFTLEDVVYFVEVKHLLPELNMFSRKGVQRLDSKIDSLIFKEDTDSGGLPFQKKVSEWRSQEPDSQIWHSPSDKDDREKMQIPDEWLEMDHEILVVTNFVPSYIEKKGVRFLTDLEFYQWIENDEDVFYNVLH